MSQDKIDLSDLNKTKKQVKLPKLKAPLKKQSGPTRDSEGKFATKGSGGLLFFQKFNWLRILPVIVVVALVGGYYVYRSFASSALLALPGSGTGQKDCSLAGGVVVKETSGSKRNANTCELSSGKMFKPLIFGNNSTTATTETKYLNLTKKLGEPSGYFKACYNFKSVSSGTGISSSASITVGGYSPGSNPSGGATYRVGPADYNADNPWCDPAPYKAGSTRLFVTVNSGTLRVVSIALYPTSAPTTPTPTPTPPPTTGSWWKPAKGVTWQWQLTGTIDTSVNAQVFDVDLENTPKSTIDTLHGQGKKVICYFSLHYEDWRGDAKAFTDNDNKPPHNRKFLGNNYEGWQGEKYVDWSHPAFMPIMLARLDSAKQKGCDGVEPDNIDQYSGTGFSYNSATTAIKLQKDLTNAAHSRGMAIGVKNFTDDGGIQALADVSDYAVNEECMAYDECGAYVTLFINKNKPVFNAEYEGGKARCTSRKPAGFSSIYKTLDLGKEYSGNYGPC